MRDQVKKCNVCSTLEKKTHFIKTKCINCDKFFQRRKCLNRYSNRPVCNISCRGQLNKKSGDERRGHGANWKGGKVTTTQGYIEIWQPKHPHAGSRGYIYEHRLIIEKKLGRYLNPNEVVHHINGIRNDNREKNLMVFSSNREHKLYENNKTFNNL